VIVEKFEVLVAAWQVHATAWQFYRHTKEDKPAEASRGAPKPASSRCEFFRKDEPLRASFLSAPLLLASSARRQTRERSLEDPRNEDGGRNREVAHRLRHGTARFASQRN